MFMAGWVWGCPGIGGGTCANRQAARNSLAALQTSLVKVGVGQLKMNLRMGGRHSVIARR